MSDKSKFRDWLESHVPEAGQDSLDPSIPIGAASRLTGLSESALRKYESAGLINYYRTEGNYRMLSTEDIDRILLIKSLVREKGLNLEGIRRLWSLIPCWELKECSPEIYNDCGVRLDSDRPCWVVRREENMCGGEECRECVIYRFGSYCTDDFKTLVYSKLRK
ncbi:MAG: MerR family transcriptional regulator [Candidatus Electryonea clarkiae]|nr:MerR family transcriptional regulator [Candidatus Electryonea clarkiae]MDP8286499.1 MerR family transcriptional regulator [Candidatus Electryonea clarkiae]